VKNYLQKNWKHLAGALVGLIVTTLAAAGTISAQTAGEITGVALALGLVTTTNSGTTGTPSGNNGKF